MLPASLRKTFEEDYRIATAQAYAVTEPGGVTAIKVDLPSNPKARKVEEARLIEALRRAHSGFMLIRGTAHQVEPSAIKEWSLWAFVWALIWLATIWFYMSTRH
jgi:hypothetical protein